MIRVAALVVALVISLTASACSADRPTEQTVRGVLIDLRATSLVHAEHITFRADDGRTLTFRVDPEVATNGEEPQSASHLRQHMVLGESLVVRYRDTPEGPLAVRIVDAP